MNKNEKLAARLELAAKIARDGLDYQARDSHGPDIWSDQTTRSVLYYTDEAWENFEIRIKPATTKVPLEPEDIPPGSIVGRRDRAKGTWFTVMAVYDKGIHLNTSRGRLSFQELYEEVWEISRPGQDWQPCYKEIP